ncbi:MAG: Isovaleryl-CoA dehydrogenase [Promethearchaeota archaeon]|nr:MAG: Isovaleryl-CoA dehydrogenase [Candidatus Lokiarchaeota archaeon]
MDVRIEEFEPIEVEKNIPELDLLNSTLLNEGEKGFLHNFYRFMEEELLEDIKQFEELNYKVEEPIENKKKRLVIAFLKKLSDHGYYSTILNQEDFNIGRITRNVLIGLSLSGGFWSERTERYIPGNYSLEMGRLAGGTLYCNPVNYKANQFQREKFLFPVAKDGAPAASAMTEFNAGSDIFRLECKIDDSEDVARITGKKLFITNGVLADYIVLYGRRNSGDLGAIVFETNHQNLENFESSRVRMFGMDDAFVSRLIFNGTEFPKENILEGNGLDIMFHQLTEERLVISAEALGDTIRKMYLTHAFAKRREQFKKRLHQYQCIRFPIAEDIRELNILLYSLLSHARDLDAHPELGSSKMMAQNAMGLKVKATEISFQSTMNAYRTLGGRAFTKQFSNQMGLLDSFCMLHGGGSNYVLGDAESRRTFKS